MQVHIFNENFKSQILGPSNKHDMSNVHISLTKIDT